MSKTLLVILNFFFFAIIIALVAAWLTWAESTSLLASVVSAGGSFTATMTLELLVWAALRYGGGNSI
ncbi:hypothetical protein [Actinoplanes cyaneus]|uniref:hypothetical protein n=1 Tax=Actinoplanes cyaneus TaxID=52696 RepID=UPI0019451446|nr:hypothetical protein [Actinoplanes cyaneus]MCW2139114.1 hypothetical protein [Actinoplanes cyaneus]